MLKDYFNSNLSSNSQTRIARCLEKVPSYCVFSSYGQARAYRAANCAVRENGRYDYTIFLYDGFYYVVSKEQFHDFKNFLHHVKLNDNIDKEVSYCNRRFDDILNK